MRIGEWNHLEVNLGARGTGKSTWEAYRALLLQRRGGAYVIGHSLGGRLPRRLPAELGGVTLPIQYHETIAGVERGLAWHPARWHILAPKPGQGETADDVLMLSQRLSDAVRKKYWERAHPFSWSGWKHNSNHEGVECPPIVVIIDEGIAVESAGASRKEGNRWFLEYLISLRHLHIALLWSLQDPTARSWRVLEQATDLWIFRVHHQWALNALAAAGASPDQVAEIATLPDHRHVHVEPGAYDWRRASAVKHDDTGTKLRTASETDPVAASVYADWLEEQGATAEAAGVRARARKRSDK